MHIAVGSDHAGFTLKLEVLRLLKELGHPYYDFGTYSTDPVDYPDYAKAVAEAVASGQYDCGIILCGSGIGASITANKVKGIRAALCHDTFSARSSREHNDANVLCFGERVIGPGLARDIVTTWLSSEFNREERHMRRVEKIKMMESC